MIAGPRQNETVRFKNEKRAEREGGREAERQRGREGGGGGIREWGGRERTAR